MLDIQMEDDKLVKIKAIGIGGGGGNAINRMMESGVTSVECVAINTDAKALKHSKAIYKLQIGDNGLGAGSKPDVAQRAAEKSKDQIYKLLEDTDMVFITAGMGGGTGTGASPVVAQIAKEMGILTVGIVTTPFDFELAARMKIAKNGVEELKKHVDTLIIIENQRLFEISGEDDLFDDAFKKSDEVLMDGVFAVADIILNPGQLGVDFADIRTIMLDQGVAHMGVGRASGANRSIEATKRAVCSPLLSHSIKGCKNCLISVKASKKTFSMKEFGIAGELIKEIADPDALVITGVVFDDSMKDDVMVTVIATAFDSKNTTNMQDDFNQITGAKTPAKHANVSDAINSVNYEFESLFSDGSAKKAATSQADVTAKPAQEPAAEAPKAKSTFDFKINDDGLEIPPFLRIKQD